MAVRDARCSTSRDSLDGSQEVQDPRRPEAIGLRRSISADPTVDHARVPLTLEIHAYASARPSSSVVIQGSFGS